MFFTLLLAANLEHGDRAITRSNVGHLSLRWRTRLRSVADSAPVLVRGMLFITAGDGTTYAINSATGEIAWRFVTHGPNITTSVPAADPSGSIIYTAGVDGFEHKLNAASGKEIRERGFPVRITTMPQTEKNASALSAANGYVYAVTSGYFGDAPPYVGHVVAIRLSDGRANVFNTLCSDRHTLPTAASCAHSGSGIWSRAGAVVDPDAAMHGRVYVATGNGNFDGRSGGDDYGDSVIALSADATRVLGYYTPENFAELEQGDVDLGSSAPALLPRDRRSRTPLMLVQGGKDDVLRLLDRAKLPGVGGELQQVDLGSRLYSTPAVWRDGSKRTWIFLGMADGVLAYRVETDGQGVSRLVHAWSANAGETEEGTSPVVNNGIVFIAMNGALVALDALTGNVLWNSARNARTSIGNVHWQSPIAVDGGVYCADQDGNMFAYGVP